MWKCQKIGIRYYCKCPPFILNEVSTCIHTCYLVSRGDLGGKGKRHLHWARNALLTARRDGGVELAVNNRRRGNNGQRGNNGRRGRDVGVDCNWVYSAPSRYWQWSIMHSGVGWRGRDGGGAMSRCVVHSPLRHWLIAEIAGSRGDLGRSSAVDSMRRRGREGHGSALRVMPRPLFVDMRCGGIERGPGSRERRGCGMDGRGERRWRRR